MDNPTATITLRLDPIPTPEQRLHMKDWFGDLMREYLDTDAPVAVDVLPVDG